MSTPRPGAHNGGPVENRVSQPRMSSAQSLSRPFTLYEALPYTPFTSIVPFDSGILPAPTIGSVSPAPSLIDLVSSQEFDALNQEALGHDPLPRRLQQTANQIQHLVERNGITEFKFKTGPRSASASSAKPTSLASTLTPISKMVYDQTTAAFRYPTPDTPTQSPPPNGQQVQARTSTTSKPSPRPSPLVPKAEQLKSSSAAPKNKHAHAQNAARLEIVLPTKSQLERASSLVKSSASPTITPVPLPQIPRASVQTENQQLERPPVLSPHGVKPKDGGSLLTPKQPTAKAPSGTQKTGITVELPKTSFNKSEYLIVPDEPEEPINLSARKRKREGLDGDDGYGESLDLRQRSDAAFNELRVFLQNVQHWEHEAQQNQSGNDYVVLTLEGETTLSAQAQTKAQTLLNKAINLNCFKSVPLDDLLRLQRLCDSALKQLESLDYKVEASWATADVEHWQQQLPSLQITILAARTSLRMMCGGRKDKQLYSENVIERCLDLIKGVTDGIVIPIAELRSTGDTAELFKCLSSSKKKIVALFNDCQKLFTLMAVLITKVDTSGTVTSGLEYAASRLVFMETANAEKDSVIETQKFDGLRLAAMDMLSQIFLLNPMQRRGIFDDIMSSLEKLPVGKRARTFKLVDGTSIQPVSALIMRLVQTSAGKVGGARLGGRSTAFQSMDDDDDEEDTSNINGATAPFSVSDEEQAAAEYGRAIEELRSIAAPLMEAAQRDANYVVQFIVGRALKSTKSGDTPFRNLLDLFVEDFTLCLDNPDWPAAEMLLVSLMATTSSIYQAGKSVTGKIMAIEVLGNMGAAISKLRGHVRKTASALDARDADELGMFLRDLATSALEQSEQPEHMVAWTGPYRATLEYLQSRFAEDPHLSSAITLSVSNWANQIHATCRFPDSDPERDHKLGRLAYRLRQMIQDRQWLSNQFSFKEVSSSQARLSYSIILLQSPLCVRFRYIMEILLRGTTSDQPTVKSRSLKSINQVLEADPSILDSRGAGRKNHIVELIESCLMDPSIQVRDSALNLIGKCISLRPALEDTFIDYILNRFNDLSLGVRKRAMKLAKDIYLRNSNKKLRSRVAESLIRRTLDMEDSVKDLALQMMEEIWFAPFHDGESSAVLRTSLADHVSLMVHTVKDGRQARAEDKEQGTPQAPPVAPILERMLQALLAPESKSAQSSAPVCKKLVASMFELIDNEDSTDPDALSSRDVLSVLMLFAKADANLFTFEQLCLLKPVIQSIKTNQDSIATRAVVTIYRRVLPQLSTAHSNFLSEVRGLLLPALPSVSRSLVDDIVACAWIISVLLEDFHSLSTLLRSAVEAIEKMRKLTERKNLPEGLATRQLVRYALIVGMICKHCQLDGKLGHQEAALKASFPKWNGASVSKLTVDTVLPFANPRFPLEVRKAALDSTGLICESSPRNYASPNVYTAFQQVFDSEPPSPELESVILGSFKEFLSAEEKRSEQNPDADALKGKTEKKRELTVIGGTNYDDIASATTNRFLKDIRGIAMSGPSDRALLATEVIGSINRQGLVHPKETIAVFIALETSTNPRIAECAVSEHRRLHAKHETVVEREYVKALQVVFEYQRDIAGSPRGAYEPDRDDEKRDANNSKLHNWMDVLKISRTKNRHKFLEKLCAQIDFDVSKLDVSSDSPPHAQYAQFIVDNLAFFEYLTVGELHAVVSDIEKLVTSTGATVAQAIESEVLGVRMDALDTNTADPSAQASTAIAEVDPKRLRQLVTGAMILLAAWEVRTYLRRLYNMGTNRRDSKAKAQAKDLSKAPVKVQGVSAYKLWADLNANLTALSSRERMKATCEAFVELMNVDKEFLVQDEDEGLDGEGPATPSMDSEEEGDEPSAGRGRKRKAQGNTPSGRKKRARSSSQPRKRGRPRKVPAAEDLDADGEFEEWA